MFGLALIQSKVQVNDTWLDYFIIAVYFVFVLGIGAIMRNRMQTSEDYFLSGRSLPSWVTGLAFLGGTRDHGHGSRRRPVRHHAVPLLLDRGDPGDGLRGAVHDPLLLRQPRPLRAGLSQAPLQRGHARL